MTALTPLNLRNAHVAETREIQTKIKRAQPGTYGSRFRRWRVSSGGFSGSSSWLAAGGTIAYSTTVAAAGRGAHSRVPFQLAMQQRKLHPPRK